MGRAERIVIACGGSGGHLFPGLAVAEELLGRGCAVTLFVSQKECDRRGIDGWLRGEVEVVALPAVGLQRGNGINFLRGFIRSYQTAKKTFAFHPPQAAIAMGGFTGPPVLLAAKRMGARIFIHESNAVPGRANRWLSRIADEAFVGFPSGVYGMHCRKVTVTGTPVRSQIYPRDPAECRKALGLDPDRPVALVMGGSQGATEMNGLVIRSLPLFKKMVPDLQWFHLSGASDCEKVKAAYAGLGLKAVVHPFFDQMELALGAATAAITRAGASTLAELSAMRVPAVLIPYPSATHNHQYHNARMFVQSGAGRLMEQSNASPERLAELVMQLIGRDAAWPLESSAPTDCRSAAERVADAILEIAGRSRTVERRSPTRRGPATVSAGAKARPASGTF